MSSILLRLRKSSYPFISGDSFLHLATSAVLNESSNSDTRKALNEVVEKPYSGRPVLFVEASYFEKKENFNAFCDLASSDEEKLKRNTTLIIHNGDVIPNAEQFQILASLFLKVHTVNATNELTGIGPLPIGLENRHHKKNGIGKEFHLDTDQVFNINRRRSSDNRIFSSFSLSTNVEERSELLCSMEQHGCDYSEPKLKPRRYRQEVLRSQFVLSPPGNGIDCHRTWEAMYLGAIPVVLERYLHHSLISMFPIFATETWEKFLKKSDSELMEIINNFDRRKYPALTMDFWMNRIKNEPGV